MFIFCYLEYIVVTHLIRCVFYGDLYGTKGENPQEPVSQLGDMIRARKLYAYGELRDYWDHMNCVGWVRMGEETEEGKPNLDGCAVVLCNGTGEGSKRMEVGKVSMLFAPVPYIVTYLVCFSTAPMRSGRTYLGGILARLSLEKMDGPSSNAKHGASASG